MHARPPLRVHIAPVGFEEKRVTEPLIRLRADRVYFLRRYEADDARKSYGKIISTLRSQYKTIEIREEFEDIWDFTKLLRLYGGIVQREVLDGNLVYVNVSTCTKITAMVGLLSGMFWGTTPYYATTSYEKGTEVVHDVKFLPIGRFKIVSDELRAVILAVRQANRSVSKDDLLRSLRETKAFPAMGDLSRASEYRRLDAMLGQLEAQGFVDMYGVRRGRRVQLSEQGRAAALLLEVTAKTSV